MSHAALVVALDGIKKAATRDEITQAIDYQMAPFYEGDEWFADGSRWDWWQIGGRFTGGLTGYDPTSDPANQKTCDICDGTGIRPGGKKQFGEDWFKHCNGCNGCHGKGTRIRWQLVPYEGDIIRASQLDKAKFQGAYAFLRNRHWHERERLGWYGSSARSECELAHPDNPDILTRRCTTKAGHTGKIVVWNEPWEIWKEAYYARFLEKLPPTTTLVLVDYHI